MNHVFISCVRSELVQSTIGWLKQYECLDIINCAHYDFYSHGDAALPPSLTERFLCKGRNDGIGLSRGKGDKSVSWCLLVFM